MAFFQSVLTNIFQPLVVLGFAVALAVFIWGLVELIRNADSPEERTTGRWHILWGVIGFAIILGVYGLLGIICNTIGGNCLL